jgi:sec-independent protein translocase protein TatA
MILPLALHLPFMDEWGVILVIGLLLFGKRLPEVGRSIGKGIVEFKKGLAGIEDEIDQAAAAKPTGTAPTVTPAPMRPAIAADQKFDPYTGQPIQPQLAGAVPAGAKFDPYTGKPLGDDVVSATPQTSSV